MEHEYECDGCGRLGSLTEIEDHINEAGTLPDGSLKEPDDVKCWGAMIVGGEAWAAFHNEGIHPMATLINTMIIPAYAAHGTNVLEDMLQRQTPRT